MKYQNLLVKLSFNKVLNFKYLKKYLQLQQPKGKNQNKTESRMYNHNKKYRI